MTDKFADIIARELNIRYNSVANTLQLLNEGCTIPFISRYRKERTGGLDEVSISAISDMGNKLNEIANRKETFICHTNPSDEQGLKLLRSKGWSRLPQ